MRFEFATATRILFGEGLARELPAVASAMGKRALVVTGANPGRSESVVASLRAAGVACVPIAVKGEPTVDLIRTGAEFAREEQCDMVIAIGGGSAIDAGKALAAMIANPGDPLDYLEVIGRGQPLTRPSTPFIAIPTTAGTGSEVTRNAVLGSPEHRVKASLRSASMLPKVALIDPELTFDLPQSVTASTGLDALTQVIEPYLSVRANPMTDLFCREGIRCAAAALPKVWENPHNREARAEMSWASLLGGLALANAGLGAVHGFAAPVGGMFPAPHGAICAAVLPHAFAINLRALRTRAPGSQALGRCEEVALLLTGRPQATAEDGVKWIEQLCRRLEIPPLRTYGVSDEDIPVLVEKASKASSMKGNPIPLDDGELREIIAAAI
ncbi:MAG TPA: iron-containing alcohol dehydrogenase [Bryobacteraceae bacterium]|nr:iron-containing alcohol dehydrogenase [Bryobacteraceae bacterium]